MEDIHGNEHDESNGQFTSNGSTAAENKRADELIRDIHNPKQNAIDEKLGKEYMGFKGADAIEKLLTEKQGHIKAAFSHDEIGDIDLVWGDEHSGLAHIIKRRDDDFKEGIGKIKGIDMVRKIPQIIESGTFHYNKTRKSFEIELNNELVIVRPQMYDDSDIKWVLTAYELN